MDLVARIKELAVAKKTNFAEIERATGISNGQIRRWNKASPNISNLSKVADHLGVSVDYLLGRSDIPQTATDKISLSIDELLKSNTTLFYDGVRLSDEEKRQAEAVLKTVLWHRLNENQKNIVVRGF